MKFFLPAASDPQQAEEKYEGIRKFIAGQVGPLTEKRIFRIQFSHDGGQFDLRVGEIHPQLAEPVIAILEGHIYYICTSNRGVLRGRPYLVGRDRVISFEEFESDEPEAAAASATP